MTFSLQRGGKQFLDWDETRYLLAGIYDWSNVGAVAAGHWEKGKAPKMTPWPTPEREAVKPVKKKRSLREIYTMFKSQEAGVNGG